MTSFTSPSFTVTFPTVKVASNLDQLMKSEEFKAFREDDKALDGFTVEMFKLYSGAIIAVATGVFVGTLSVVKELDAWNCNWLLGFSWALTTAAVVMAFVELLLSQFGAYLSKEILAWRLENHDYNTAKRNPFSDWCRYLMVATCITLALGVVLSAIFIFQNRKSPRRTNESAATPKGMATCPICKANGSAVANPASRGHGEPAESGQHRDAKPTLNPTHEKKVGQPEPVEARKVH